MSLKDLTIVIPFRAQSERRKEIFEWILSRYKILFSGSQIIVADSDPTKPFSRSQSRNVGVSSVKTEYVLIADADTIPFYPFIKLGYESLINGANWVIPYGKKGYFNLKKPYSDKVLSMSCDSFITPDLFEWDFQLESWAGQILMKTQCFHDVNGYDERFVGWGYEDNSFQKAMDTLVGPFTRIESGWTAHIWHHAAEAETWSQPHIENNRRLHSLYAQYSGNQILMSELVAGNRG
jgi:predicted glycosyltransferase involved in capsule biosynthesis